MRNLIALNLDPENKSASSMQDKELKKAFELILDRATRGVADEEDVAFAKARREYLSDTELKTITGMTFDEIEASISKAGRATEETSLKSLTVEELKAKAEELGVELTGDEKKADLIAKLEEASK